MRPRRALARSVRVTLAPVWAEPRPVRVRALGQRREAEPRPVRAPVPVRRQEAELRQLAPALALPVRERSVPGQRPAERKLVPALLRGLLEPAVGVW
jgi:hypothetical protein